MANHNIDQIVKNKIENLNFEFKDEYWTQMEEKISTNSSSGAASGTAGISSFLGSVLFISVSILVTLLLVYLWIFKGDSAHKIDESSTIESPIELVIDSEPAIQTNEEKNSMSIPDPLCDGDLVEEESDIVEQVKPESKKQKITAPRVNKTKINSSKNPQTVKEPVSVETDVNQEPKKKVATSIETYDTTKKDELELDEQIDHEPKIESQVIDLDKGVDNEALEVDLGYSKQIVSLESDSVYIPDAKLLGDHQGENKSNGQVDIDAGPKQVKTVKPKNKPVKHVFNKRRGFLYRIGLRK